MKTQIIKHPLDGGAIIEIPLVELADVQKSCDERGIEIDKVGVCDLVYPIVVLDKEKGKQGVCARISMSVNLPHHFKGTHMSRFLEVLGRNSGGEMSMLNLPMILEELKEKLEAVSAHIEVEFTYFIERMAPVSLIKAPMDYLCAFIGSGNGNGEDEFMLRVRVPVATLCPCSKEISDYGAHNQRGYVTISVRTLEWVWIEELIDIAEMCCSAPVYALLKRRDERYVTMKAYDNPMFVEDVVRGVAMRLREDARISWFEVRAVNNESIHNHSAFAVVKSK